MNYPFPFRNTGKVKLEYVKAHSSVLPLTVASQMQIAWQCSYQAINLHTVSHPSLLPKATQESQVPLLYSCGI